MFLTFFIYQKGYWYKKKIYLEITNYPLVGDFMHIPIESQEEEKLERYSLLLKIVERSFSSKASFAYTINFIGKIISIEDENKKKIPFKTVALHWDKLDEGTTELDILNYKV